MGEGTSEIQRLMIGMAVMGLAGPRRVRVLNRRNLARSMATTADGWLNWLACQACPAWRAS